MTSNHEIINSTQLFAPSTDLQRRLGMVYMVILEAVRRSRGVDDTPVEVEAASPLVIANECALLNEAQPISQ